MLGGHKPTDEKRFELMTWGAILIVAAVLYLTVFRTLPSLMLFIPGLILLGSAIFQDLQPDWHTGWPTYLLAIIMVAVGLAGIVNSLMGDVVKIPWLVVAAVLLGAVLLAKAFYDPSLGPRRPPQ